MITLDESLDPACLPLAWLLGRWEGAGVGQWPDGSGYRFGQELVIGHDGRAFLAYESASWVLTEDGTPTGPGPRETGYLRPVAPIRADAGRSDADPDPDPDRDPDGHDTELLLAHHDGIVELYLGRRTGARLELATDAVVRTAAAPGRAAAHRLYGLVEGDLLWAWDAGDRKRMAAVMSARLRRVGDAAGPAVPPGLVGLTGRAGVPGVPDQSDPAGPGGLPA